MPSGHLESQPHKLFWGEFTKCVGCLRLKLYLLCSKNTDPVNRPVVWQHIKVTHRHERRFISGYYISRETREKYCGNMPCSSISVWAECGTAGWAGLRKGKRSWVASDTARSPDLGTVLSWLLVLWYISVFVKAFSQHMAFKEKVWRVSPCVEQLLPALARGTIRAGEHCLRHRGKFLPCSEGKLHKHLGFGLFCQHTFRLKCEAL